MQALLDWITSFFSDGIYTLFEQLVKYFLDSFLSLKLKFMLWALNISWSIGSSVISSLNISSELQSAFSYLDSNTLGIVYWLHVPEGINMILAAFVARYVLKLIPFSGF